MKPARLPAFLAAGVLCACGPAADGAAGDPARDADSMAEAAELAAREACGDAATISGNGVGTLTLGMSVTAARDACDMRDTTFTLGEGLMESGLTTSLAAGGAIVALTTDSDSVLRLIVTGAGPATEQGIGVGSSIASVREAYPDACVMSGEGRLVAIAPNTGVSFMTTSPVGPANPRIENVPDTTTVFQVIVHGSDGVCP